MLTCAKVREELVRQFEQTERAFPVTAGAVVPTAVWSADLDHTGKLATAAGTGMMTGSGQLFHRRVSTGRCSAGATAVVTVMMAMPVIMIF